MYNLRQGRREKFWAPWWDKMCLPYSNGKFINGPHEGSEWKSHLFIKNEPLWPLINDQDDPIWTLGLYSLILIICSIRYYYPLIKIIIISRHGRTNERDECYQMGNLRHKPSIRQILGKVRYYVPTILFRSLDPTILVTIKD